MTETLTMEAIADAGEIGISPTLAVAARSGLRRAAEGGGDPPGRRRPTVERHRAPDVGDVASIDIASAHPGRRARPRRCSQRASPSTGRSPPPSST